MRPELISRLNCQGYATLLTAVGLLAAGFARAEDEKAVESTGTNQPAALSVDVRRNVEGTYVPYRYAFVTAGSEKYTFLVPEAYRVDTSDPTKVKLASADFSGMIIMGLVSGSSGGEKMSAEALQAKVMASYPEATINGQQTTCANGQAVPALDFSWKSHTGVTRKSRTTYVPVTGGLMEFTLSASPDSFETSLQQLNLVLMTFRTSSNGKFDYVIGSKFP